MKTWADLKHGDVVGRYSMRRTVIDVLPHSVLLAESLNGEIAPLWVTREELEKYWQIVQPEEEYRKELEKAQFCDPRI